MNLHRHNIRYDPLMEILCTLPPSPANVPVSMIAADMKMTFNEVGQALVELRELGHELVVENKEGERVASVAPTGWAKAKRAGVRYWNKVNKAPQL